MVGLLENSCKNPFSVNYRDFLYLYFMKKLTIIILLLSLYSCDIMKKSSKQKSDTDFEETIKTQSFRMGDTISLPVYNYVYKDTVITTVSTQGTILKTYYDKSGNVNNIDCISSKVDELKEENRRFQQQMLNKDKEKEENFDSTAILYLIGGIAFIIIIIGCVGLYLLYRHISKTNQTISNVIGMVNEIKKP